MFEGIKGLINPVLIGIFVSSVFQLTGNLADKEKKKDFIFDLKYSLILFSCIVGFNLWHYRAYVFRLINPPQESLTQKEKPLLELVKKQNQEWRKKEEEREEREEAEARQYEFLTKYGASYSIEDEEQANVIRKQNKAIRKQTQLLEQINNELQFQHVQRDF